MTGATTHPFVARVSRALEAREARRAERDEPYGEAAVAVILRPSLASGAELLLIRRADREGDPWSGQIGLPGGRVDPTDPSLEATAIRETHEEVGIDLARSGEILGVLDELRPRTPHLPPIIVRPFVAVVHEAVELRPNREVAEARWVSLDALLTPSARVRTEVAVRGMTFHVEAFQHEEFIVWGMTERILTGFAERLAP
ncbi:MAG: CoA pyrophosphatase [Gemmatimonadota bacterium]|nr:CoA pyrophosphatase [Gemmatimonadota bacterium]MDQ8169381.1 CoA pyrophosphatase [Gemmatimonadota bacterium]